MSMNGERPASNRSSMKTYTPPGKPKYFKSRRIDKKNIDKPWITMKRDPREIWQTVIPMCGFLVGMGLAAFLIWHGYNGVSRNLYCPVMVDDFSKGLDPQIWQKEVEVGGYGVGTFEATTTSHENIFIDNGTLIIRPTLTDRRLIEHDTILDLRSAGCTGASWTDCVTSTNTTNGTIINPVRSGRLNTKRGAKIKYGRVEVTAKLPMGDWLWPSITLLPANNTYGEWPKSGEISIMQSRGNNYTYAQGGNNVMTSCLHFGPSREWDGWWRNNKKSTAYRETFSDRFHKFGVEWTEKYIFTYIDTRLLQVAYQSFDKPFWDFGQFPTADRNGTRFINPWEYGTHATPFDQDFYLTIRLSVGSTNGWFEDNRSGKPWLDADTNAKLRFWQARHQWLPSWQEKGWLEVESVKMWQQAGYGGCRAEKASRLVG
ncbi:glucan endo-1,3-beta-D-glucosidase [Bimuria novae-zelandiae CBS 107.79]|uniref:Glucan endo-1,3-beta-D-glucosidase n=1 Tax=Bimuria novae-zelandiae CBS 107.79 TaxID=1447943 RepID=A0A6A5VLD4_9PLEO|nr:glucan endo-1,3-beta-D-glucosidase [Bimuria novae-zelandiae CBS 107.79]